MDLDDKNKQDYLMRKFLQENASYYDSNGDIPLVLDKNGRILSREEIIELTK